MTFGENKKRYFGNFILVVLSISFSVILGEAILRVILDPLNYLRPYLVHDAILGVTVMPHSSGHDSWGYRNQSVPDSVEIVTIGDSQTYGIAAPAKYSWPEQLHTLTHKSVYNLSLGGYSTAQYLYLLKTRALKLKPSLIIVGFYLGNDLLGTYRNVYTRPYWQYLRNPDFAYKEVLQFDDKRTNYNIKHRIFMEKVRNWLAHHSVFYRAAILSFGDTLRFLEMKFVHRNEDVTILEDKTNNVYAGFTPKIRLSALNIKDPRVQEGLALSLDLINQMNMLCLEKAIDFLVVLIPTQESVYSEYIENNTELENSGIINQLLINERAINKTVKTYFDEHTIAYIDILEPLRSAVGQKSIYPQNINGHPNKEGYGIIAESIQNYLDNENLTP